MQSLRAVIYMSSQPFTKLFKLCANVSLGGFLFVCAHASADASQDAGEVTFLIGKAFINGSTPVEIGSKISSGDEIQTLSNGHVHVRFIDNGLISVRPDSRLAIEHYDYNPDAPQSSVIKFNLEDGVMRSISGAGAKAARDKFRLNTPIAAIGVRGTDFVVKASDDLLQAVVNEGAIVVAPFSDDCTVSSTGPCQANTVELSSLSNQLLEFTTLSDSPRLLPLSSAVKSNLLDDSSTTDDSTKDVENSSQSSNGKTYQEAAAISYLRDVERDAIGALSEPVSTIPTTPTSSKISWGRYGLSSASSALSNMAVNSAGNGLHPVTSASTLHDGQIYSYRTLSSDYGLAANANHVSFKLAAAQASLTTTSGAIESVEVLGGALDIDFASLGFTTQLELYNPTTSLVQFNASGTLDNRGFFSSTSNDASISLITTVDGTESSYYFKQQVDSGAIEGITYWQD